MIRYYFLCELLNIKSQKIRFLRVLLLLAYLTKLKCSSIYLCLGAPIKTFSLTDGPFLYFFSLE